MYAPLPVVIYMMADKVCLCLTAKDLIRVAYPSQPAMRAVAAVQLRLTFAATLEHELLTMYGEPLCGDDLFRRLVRMGDQVCTDIW